MKALPSYNADVEPRLGLGVAEVAVVDIRLAYGTS